MAIAIEAVTCSVLRDFHGQVYMKALVQDISEERRLTAMEHLLKTFLPATMPPEHQKKEAHNMLLFASMLTKLYPRAKELAHRLQQQDSYLSSTFPELQSLYDFVQWKPLLQEVFSTTVYSSDTVYVMAPNYMAGLTRTLAHFQPRIIHNTLLLIFATDILNELVNSTLSDNDRPSFCMKVCMNVMSQPVSALYVTQYTPQYLHHLSVRVRDMFNKLRRTLENRIKTLSWLDDMSRTAALRKVAALRGHFLTWPQLWNQTYLTALMDQMDVTEHDFFHNVITRYKQIRTPPGDFHKEQPSDKKWAFPFVVNAFYDVTLNSIVIPLAVLTQPYFNKDVPLYIPYATMGLVFSHEMLHGFDLLGVDYGETGLRSPWMTPEARLRLEARLECVAKQYRAAFQHKVQFMGDLVDVQFDWNITRNENMADVSGLQIAYETWRSLPDHMGDFRLPGLTALSPTQLFLLQAGQVYCSDMSAEDYIILVEKDFHTPPPERVNGIMMNFPPFSEAFSCSPGTNMNPFRKCSIY
ncbi:hypothetical protein J6590_056435 [Homalodisca vitripennis]|nr:hypothetical protein J6590_056435 [Homalodisca vitripennis]